MKFSNLEAKTTAYFLLYPPITTAKISNYLTHCINFGKKYQTCPYQAHITLNPGSLQDKNDVFQSVGHPFQLPEKANSCLRRIRLFLAKSSLEPDLVVRIIFSILPQKGSFTLATDRRTGSSATPTLTFSCSLSCMTEPPIRCCSACCRRRGLLTRRNASLCWNANSACSGQKASTACYQAGSWWVKDSKMAQRQSHTIPHMHL